MAEENDGQITIIPAFKMILNYDIRPSNPEAYYQFVLGEFVPSLQQMGVYMAEAWQTAYGEHPMRMIIFITEDYDTLQSAFESERWQQLEGRLLSYVRNYSRKVVHYRPGFQVVR